MVTESTDSESAKPASIENGKKGSRRRTSMVLGGGRQSLIIVLLLLMLAASGSRQGATFGPFSLLIALGIGIYIWLRVASYFFGRAGRWIAVLMLFIGTTAFGVIKYQAELRFEDLVARLARYDEIIVRQRGGLLTSAVGQISFRNNVDDDLVEKVVRMPELSQVSYVYLESPLITDRGLRSMNSFSKLEYIYIDSPEISDEAILEFEQSHPRCSVIVPNHR